MLQVLHSGMHTVCIGMFTICIDGENPSLSANHLKLYAIFLI